MKYMLDTNICIELLRGQGEPVVKRLMRHAIDDIVISSITLSELEYGVAKSSYQDRNRLVLTKFVSPLTILPYDEYAAAAYGHIRAALEKRATPIGALDMLIAAHAVSLQATLVTNNEREFRRIHELKVKNWLT